MRENSRKVLSSTYPRDIAVDIPILIWGSPFGKSKSSSLESEADIAIIFECHGVHGEFVFVFVFYFFNLILFFVLQVSLMENMLQRQTHLSSFKII